MEAYLDIDGIIELAKRKEVDAIHPGYGFLAENAEFARALRGGRDRLHRPDARARCELFGDKVAARRIAQEAGAAPRAGGTDEPVSHGEEALAFAERWATR